jgi:hypothetical protein
VNQAIKKQAHQILHIRTRDLLSWKQKSCSNHGIIVVMPNYHAKTDTPDKIDFGRSAPVMAGLAPVTAAP